MSGKEEHNSFDGCTAAAHIAYAMSDVAIIYPITPSSPIGEFVDQWAAEGRKNIFNQILSVTEMQSEAGAAGAVHGSAAAGALTSTYTCSQGLLLMIPNLYKISGEKMPVVFHVTARAVAGQGLSIFGDHSDVMATRQTGVTLLCSSTVQEVMDLGLVAHLAAIQAGMPFIHFFDGFRTSHEVQKIKLIKYDQISPLVDFAAIKRFRARALNPEHPQMRGTSESPDIFFQLVESANRDYNAIPKIVEENMEKVAKLTGRQYHLFDYVGAPDAEHVIVVMGAGASTIEEVVAHLNNEGQKVGVVKVRLFRPWNAVSFLSVLPKSAQRICVLDRVKEAGSFGEPLYLDVASTIQEANETRLVIGGRFGLGSKDITGAMGKAIFENLQSSAPKRHFTVGIEDDLTFTSIPIREELNSVPKTTIQCLIWGLGSDGTVGANKEAIKLIGDHTEQYCQGYFEYDAKKSGGLTRSHLRFGPTPINAAYLVEHAFYVACHHPGYVGHYPLTKASQPGGIFLLNAPWTTVEELDKHLSGDIKQDLVKKKLKFYVIDAWDVAKKTQMGNFINMIMQTAFFKLSNVLPVEEALELLKKSVRKMYARKGDEVVQKNINAIDQSLSNLIEIQPPASWGSAPIVPLKKIDGAPAFVNDVMIPCGHYVGWGLPVSKLQQLCEGGIMPTGTAKYEKRGLATQVPLWDAAKCVQCNQCALMCAHACIRPYLITESEETATFKGVDGKMPALKEKKFKFRIQTSVLDCTGCGVCAEVCPVKAISMVPLEGQLEEAKNWEYALTLPVRDTVVESTLEKPNFTATQYKQPLLEFSGACGGCGETPYIKLITQLFGDRMIVANATGCSSIWGGSAPWCPYTTNKNGHGPAWANSLFEDNAEYGYGMFLSTAQRRRKAVDIAIAASKADGVAQNVKDAAAAWAVAADDAAQSRATGDALKAVLAPLAGGSNAVVNDLLEQQDLFTKKSQWIFGGDGWAYDIGFGGLDHVLACDDNVNVCVLDTEVYSNTGGQRSKATPRGAAAKFATSGKKTSKKNLGLVFMSYGYIYVAQVALGANPMQTLRAFQEAEAFPGPSIVIAYAPCLNHGIKGGMKNMVKVEKDAVKLGYWHLYRYNPLLIKEGKNPFILDSPAPSGDMKTFLYNEVRFESLTRQFKEEAERLHGLLIEDKAADYVRYKAMSDSK